MESPRVLRQRIHLHTQVEVPCGVLARPPAATAFSFGDAQETRAFNHAALWS